MHNASLSLISLIGRSVMSGISFCEAVIIEEFPSVIQKLPHHSVGNYSTIMTASPNVVPDMLVVLVVVELIGNIVLL